MFYVEIIIKRFYCLFFFLKMESCNMQRCRSCDVGCNHQCDIQCYKAYILSQFDFFFFSVTFLALQTLSLLSATGPPLLPQDHSLHHPLLPVC